ncbi:bifunctional 3-deoxy-7-phosphoheptulonate synthase/chorismate mutase type II [Nonomuraea sp. LPB2021202275-12-8]|uniref:bifunctional 3-deoxy-7-phosphoheptulonate synthase/chorismate mutase type II n=1 Tax=Nonomuraea sp. LPB2021202275-12-8 TaxID=3120159 RepID=UPI00300CA7C0
MSSTLERHVVTLGAHRVGEGPAVVISDRMSLREHRGGAREFPREGVTLAEPAGADDLPLIAARARGVVIGAAWTRDIPLVRAVAALGLPVVVERRPSATLEEWLGVAGYCAAEGNDQVILCERSDLGLLRAARAASGRPVLADVSGDIGLCAAAVAAGADGLIVDGLIVDGSQADRREAEEAVTLVGALLRPETPATLPDCRQAIDRVDAALATLLERRVALAGTVQRLKPVGGFAGRDLTRERALVARMAQRAPELGETHLAPIMNAIIEAGLHLAEERATR